MALASLESEREGRKGVSARLGKTGTVTRERQSYETEGQIYNPLHYIYKLPDPTIRAPHTTSWLGFPDHTRHTQRDFPYSFREDEHHTLWSFEVFGFGLILDP